MGLFGLGGGNATVQLLLDRADVSAGETVQATIRVSGGRKDTEIAEGRLRLVYENEYEWRERTSTLVRSSSRSEPSTRTSRQTDRKTIDERRFLERGVVRADTPEDHTLSVEIPPSSIPSGEGKITRVRWKIQATLACERTRDISDEAPLEVLSTADQDWLEPAPEVESHGECLLAFQLEKRAFGAGEPIEGTLVLTASEGCSVSEVRVELERHENVPRDLGNSSHQREAQAIVAGALELSPGVPQEFSFRLEVPPDPVPTLETANSRVWWLLKGIGARRMRRDYRVEQEVLVYSAPGAHLG
jgi:SpoOM protein